MRIFRQAVLGAAVIAFACDFASAAARKPGEHFVAFAREPKVSLISLPALNAETTVEVGQSMVSTTLTSVQPAIRTSKPVEVDAKTMTATLPSGIYVLDGLDAGGEFFRLRSRGDVKWRGVPLDDAYIGFYVSEAAEAAEAYWRPTSQPVAYGTRITLPPFERTTLRVVSPTDFRRELIYIGVSKGTVSLSYREFSNDMARPAFTQTLSYDLAEGAEIGFRGARFKILKATNIALTFIVLKPLDSRAP